MATQPENHDDNHVSNRQLLEFLLEVKALAELEKKKTKENKALTCQDGKERSYQVTSSFTTA